MKWWTRSFARALPWVCAVAILGMWSCAGESDSSGAGEAGETGSDASAGEAGGDASARADSVSGLDVRGGGVDAEGDGTAQDAGQGTSGEDISDAPLTLDDHKRQVLKSFADNFAMPLLEGFVLAAEELVSACALDAQTNSPENRQSARDAWRTAMALWQRLEVAPVGPAGAMGKVAGGMDLRDEIYSWPGSNRCRVDQETEEKAYADVEAFKAELVNVRGLDALEQLLFVEDDDNHCAANSKLNSSGAWAALTSDDIRKQRADYAHTLAIILLGHASSLEDAWEESFAESLATAGKGSDLFDTAHAGLNALSDALFYLDKSTKDMKLAIPTGISECDEETCPDALESEFAHVSRENVLANLEAFRDVLNGGQAGRGDLHGWHDLLSAGGAGDLSAALDGALESAIDLVASHDASLLQLLETDVEAARDMHTAVKEVTNLLKTEFLSALDLEIPQRAASDND